MRNETRDHALVWLALITSSSTLLCCTLPVLFVALGLGATLAMMTAQLHWWIVLAEHKFGLFLISSLMLLVAYWALRHSENSCPVDPILAKKCQFLQRWNKRIFFVSVIIWIIGFFSAYLAAPLTAMIGGVM